MSFTDRLNKLFANQWAVISDQQQGLSYGRVVEYCPVANVALVESRRHIYGFEMGNERGVWALPEVGPLPSSRLTVPSSTPALIAAVSKIVICTPKAVAAFDAVPVWRGNAG